MKKQLLSLAFTLLAILGFSNHVAALNTYAYGMSSTLSEDAATITVKYSLNADATAVALVFYNGTEAVKEVSLEGLTAGNHEVAVPTEGLPQGVQLTWAVKATSAVVETPTEHDKYYMFYHPQAVAIDKNPNSPYFGRIYVTECMNSAEGYASVDTGKGLYVYDPQLNPVLNKDGKQGFTGGNTFKSKFEGSYSYGATNYDPRKVRVSEDGRVFVSGQNDEGKVLWEVNPNELDAAWTSVIAGTPNATWQLVDADGNLIAQPNIDFDTKGAGENLEILMHSINQGGWNYNGIVSTDIYKLGTATEWSGLPQNVFALSGQYSVTPSSINVMYDNEGGIWYFQYRGTPSDSQPAIVHVNADGVEDYKNIEIVPRAAGAAFNKDFTLLALGLSGKTISVYEVGKDSEGKPTLTEKYNFAHSTGNNVNDIEWDIADNIYVVNNSGEFLKVYSLPRESGDVEVPAPAASAFTIPAPAQPAEPLTLYMRQVLKVEADQLPVKTEARQAAFANGKVYIQDKSTGTISVWDKNGKTDQVLTETGPSVAVATDDAGNVIVPGQGAAWVTAWDQVTTLKVYPADGSEAKEVEVSGLPAGRIDFLGHIYGNILSGEAILYVPTASATDVIGVRFEDGVQLADAAPISIPNSLPANAQTVVSAYGADKMVYYTRAVGSGLHIVDVAYDADMNEYTADDTYVVTTPEMYSSNGVSVFNFAGREMALYNIGTDYYDGWAMVEVSDAAENPILVRHDEEILSKNGFQTNWVFGEQVSDTKGYVYHYFPGGCYSVYEISTEEFKEEPVEPRYGLKELARFKDGLPVGADTRQAKGLNGRLYIQDKGLQQVEMWTKDGKMTEVLANSGAGTNIGHDQAGNVYTRYNGAFPASYAEGEGVLVYPVAGGEPVSIVLEGLPATRNDYYGEAYGNLLSGSAKLFMSSNGSQEVYMFNIVDGVQDGEVVVIPLETVSAADSMTHIYPYGEDSFIYNRRGGLYKVTYSYDPDMGEVSFDDTYKLSLPGLTTSNGSDIFTLGGVDYIVYTSGTGYFDGFSVAKVSNEADNAAVIVKEESGISSTSGNSWVSAEVVSETEAIIYQYCQGQVIAFYEFTIAAEEDQTPTYPEVIYTVGNDGNWAPETGSATIAAVEGEEGKYVGEISIANANEGFGYVTFIQTLGDWTTVNPTRLGAPEADYAVTPGTAISYTLGAENSFKVAAGDYEVTIDMVAGTVTFVTVAPEAVYVIGNDGTWNPSVASATLAAVEGATAQYKGEITVANTGDGYGYAALSTTLGVDANDWNGFNAGKLGAPESNYPVESEVAIAYTVGADNSYKLLAETTYSVEVDLTAGTVKFTKVSGVDGAVVAAAKVIAGVGVINVVGGAASIEVYTAGGALVSTNEATVECAPGIYMVRVDGKVSKVVVR